MRQPIDFPPVDDDYQRTPEFRTVCRMTTREVVAVAMSNPTAIGLHAELDPAQFVSAAKVEIYRRLQMLSLAVRYPDSPSFNPHGWTSLQMSVTLHDLGMAVIL